MNRGIGMENKKKINWRFNKLEYKLMEEYLQEMAMKGWFPSEINGNKATFIPTEKRKLKFYVNINPNPNPNADNLFHEGDDELQYKYKDSYEKLGWHFITSYDQMCFFYAEIYENTYFVQKDLELEQELVINKIWKKEMLKSVGLTIFYISFIAFIFYFSWFNEGIFNYKILLDWPTLFNLFVILPFAFIICIVIIIRNIIWYFKTTSNIKNNNKSLKFVKLRNKLYDIGNYIVLVISILILINNFFPRGFLFDWNTKSLFIAIIVFSVCSCIIYNIYKDKVNKKGQIIFILGIFIGVTILVYLMAKISLIDDINNPNDLQNVPEKYSIIKISDFSEINEIDYNNFTMKQSPFVPVSYHYYESYEDDSQGVYISYYASTEYYNCINEKIANIIYEGKLKENENKKYYNKIIRIISAEYWNCDKAILMSNNTSDVLLLQKDNKVIEIDISKKLVYVFDYEYKVKVLEKFINDKIN